jgi:hypothetical protein
MSKIGADHLTRRAYVYIRQSTLDQVHNNRESQIASNVAVVVIDPVCVNSLSCVGDSRLTSINTKKRSTGQMSSAAGKSTPCRRGNYLAR